MPHPPHSECLKPSWKQSRGSCCSSRTIIPQETAKNAVLHPTHAKDQPRQEISPSSLRAFLSGKSARAEFFPIRGEDWTPGVDEYAAPDVLKSSQPRRELSPSSSRTFLSEDGAPAELFPISVDSTPRVEYYAAPDVPKPSRPRQDLCPGKHPTHASSSQKLPQECAHADLVPLNGEDWALGFHDYAAPDVLKPIQELIPSKQLAHASSWRTASSDAKCNTGGNACLDVDVCSKWHVLAAEPPGTDISINIAKILSLEQSHGDDSHNRNSGQVHGHRCSHSCGHREGEARPMARRVMSQLALGPSPTPGIAKCASVSFVVGFILQAIVMPAFIVWFYLSMPPRLSLNQAPNASDPISFPRHHAGGLQGFVHYGFMYCVFSGLMSQSITFFPGLFRCIERPPDGEEFFRNGDNVRSALKELGALTAFSVAGGEARSLVLRNWLGKLTMASRLTGAKMQEEHFSDAAEIDALRKCLQSEEHCDLHGHEHKHGHAGQGKHVDHMQSESCPPLFIDIFADEKHSDEIQGLWKAWADFAATSPDPCFLSKWAECQEALTMEQATSKHDRAGDPFDAHKLHHNCGLKLDQVATVLSMTLEQVAELAALPPKGFSVKATGEADFDLCSLSQVSLQAFVKLRAEYIMQPRKHSEVSCCKSDDCVVSRKFQFHGQPILMCYAARGRPETKQNEPKLKTRNIAPDHWVCLCEAALDQHLSTEEQQQFWVWAEGGSGLDNCHKVSCWETLRSCYARVVSISGCCVTLADLSPGMQKVLTECPHIRPLHGATQKQDTLLIECLEPYFGARGKAGALNFAVRLLARRGMLCSESLFAIFDARHMPHKSFWYWTMPMFFQRRAEGGFRLNKKVGFVQSPQIFGKLAYAEDYLDLQNNFFFNVINVMRNKNGGVTSCGTNAVWLLPPNRELKHPYFEELTKIEDTATSHRLIMEGKYSFYANPKSERPINLEAAQQHPTCIGVAKKGPDYLAALQRWCEGSVQLFWVMMIKGPGRGVIVGIFTYQLLWLIFVLLLIMVQPLVFCDSESGLFNSVCKPFADMHHMRQHVDKRGGLTWEAVSFRVSVQLIESFIWIVLFVIFNIIGVGCFCKFVIPFDKLVRYVVMYDNVTNYSSSITCFYWIFVSVYLNFGPLVGQESPFDVDIGELCIWFFICTACRWTLLYSAKNQGSSPDLCLWRSSAMFVINSPGQVGACVQGALAAISILGYGVDKSWWTDPKKAVKAVAKVWTSFVSFFAVPLGLICCLATHFAVEGGIQRQQWVAVFLLLYAAALIGKPTLYIFFEQSVAWMRNYWPAARIGTKYANMVTFMIRASVELVMPLFMGIFLLIKDTNFEND